MNFPAPRKSLRTLAGRYRRGSVCVGQCTGRTEARQVSIASVTRGFFDPSDTAEPQRRLIEYLRGDDGCRILAHRVWPEGLMPTPVMIPS